MSTSTFRPAQFAHFRPRSDVSTELSSDGIADQETKDTLIADIFDVTDTDSNAISESPQENEPATVADAITDLADQLTALEGKATESSYEPTADTTVKNSTINDSSDLQRTIASINILMDTADTAKVELPIERFYSKTATRDKRRLET